MAYSKSNYNYFRERTSFNDWHNSAPKMQCFFQSAKKWKSSCDHDRCQPKNPSFGDPQRYDITEQLVRQSVLPWQLHVQKETDLFSLFNLIFKIGGATVSAQIMLRYLGLMEEALAYNPWIHKYRWKVFAQKPGHRPVGCQTIDCESWLCIKIVRSVVDRAVSSYIHTTKHAPHNGVPFSILFKMARNSGIKPEESPFRLFLEALHRNAKTPKGYQDAHYLPQADRNCDSAPGMHLVPLEGLQESLDIIHQTRGIYLNASGLTSHHYISKPATSNTTNLEPKASSLLYSDLFSSKGKFKFAYDDMFDTEEVKQLFCQVYCHDIALYAKLCRQPMVQSNALLTSVCERERQRIMAICQVDYFQN